MSLAVSAIEFLRKTLAYPDWRGSILYGLARTAFALVPIRRKLVLDALAASFPEKDEAWRRETLRGIYRHFSWMIVEFLAAVNDPKLVKKMFVEIEGREVLDNLVAEKKGAFMLCGHFSNWEVGAGWLDQSGYPMMPAARDADDKDFAALVERYRSTLGEHTLRKGAMNVLSMVRLAKSGKIIGLLADQDAGAHGQPVAFLNRRTTMVKGPATLALTAKVALITVYPLRLGPFKYKLCVLPSLIRGDEERTRENIANLTIKCNEVIENIVKQAPEQWFWFHRRWKYDPDRPDVAAQ